MVKTVLILDDNLVYADSLMQFVDELGHRAIWAQDLESARLAVRTFPLDLAILCVFLRNGERAPEILPLSLPTCIYTGIPSEAIHYGVPVFAKDYPYSLLAWVKQVLGNREDGTRAGQERKLS